MERTLVTYHRSCFAWQVVYAKHCPFAQNKIDVTGRCEVVGGHCTKTVQKRPGAILWPQVEPADNTAQKRKR